MRLQTKINIRFLTITLLVFLFAGIVFYFALGRVIDQNIREMLESRKAYIILNLQQNQQNFDSIQSPDNSIFIQRTDNIDAFQQYSDTLAYDQQEKELIPFRKLTFTAKSGNQFYKVVLLQSLLESEDLQLAIFSFLAGLFVLLLLALFFANRWLSAKAWNPFFKSLSVLGLWKIGKNQTVHFEKTGISEFDQLNAALEKMMRKIEADFVNLKEFAENASHEIQTPLAIIKSKLEMALQDKTMTDQQHRYIRSAFESVIRLSKLNEALLLLSKIENQQFVEKSEVDFCQLIATRMEFLEELFALKKIEVTLQFHEKIFFSINPLLAEILVNNLLRNALRHNIENGILKIVSENGAISFSNTGENSALDDSKLFNRFAMQNRSSDSTGLGLAICAEICKSSQLQINYHYSNMIHYFYIAKIKS